MKLSKYNIIKPLKSGNYFIFNSFSSATVIINKDDYIDFKCINSHNKNFNEWKDNFLIIDDNIDEELILEKERMNAIENCDTQHIVILLTTRCNARCFYCFEENDAKQTMTLSTAQAVVDFLINNVKANKELHIQWFGGEPLLNIQCIDYISKKIITFCQKKNLKYTSSIITNGSLITQEILDKMENNWNVVAVQISLDGDKDIYEKRKNYYDKKYNFELLLNNLCLLSNCHFSKTIRINFDKHNFSSCLELIDTLCDKIDKISNFHIYFAALYGKSIQDAIVDTTESNMYFLNIYNKLLDKKLIRSIKYFMLGHTSRHCQANGLNNYVIDSKGILHKCVHDLQKSSCDIFSKQIIEWNRPLVDIKISKQCVDCKLLPICQGGCQIYNKVQQQCVGGSGCYIYKNSMEAIFNTILKLYDINDSINN